MLFWFIDAQKIFFCLESSRSSFMKLQLERSDSRFEEREQKTCCRREATEDFHGEIEMKLAVSWSSFLDDEKIQLG